MKPEGCIPVGIGAVLGIALVFIGGAVLLSSSGRWG